jgi:hypothetical protein
MYLTCLHCLNDETTPIEDCRIYTGKYYPTGGWSFTPTPEAMDEFFGKHLHKETWEQSMYGDHFTIVTESLLGGADSFVGEKRRLMEIVAKAAEEGKVGH